MTTDRLDRLRALAPMLRERYGVQALHVFGSTARDEHTTESDLDVLVDFEATPDLYAFVEMAQTMEDALGVRVDLVTRAMLKPALAPQVLSELQPV